MFQIRTSELYFLTLKNGVLSFFLFFSDMFIKVDSLLVKFRGYNDSQKRVQLSLTERSVTDRANEGTTSI